LGIPSRVLATFPGPAYGPRGFRELAALDSEEPAFGTILKPTAGITPDEVGQLVEQAACHPLLTFVKEDENLYPRVPYSPVAERARRAAEAIARAAEQRGGKGLIFAPHVSGGPQEIVETVLAVLEAGARGVMFSETFAGGTVRLVRDATRRLGNPPAIYGHNAGIGVKTRGIWREVIDLLARLDGIDFRQTAPVRPGPPFLRPYGAEWVASERVLSEPLHGIKPATVVRAGSLDQGNIILNLQDATDRGMLGGVMFLAGSAINSVKDRHGRPDPRLGATAMGEAVEVFRTGMMRDVAGERHVAVLKDVARQRRLSALAAALEQRYPT
jgi:ribulose-bisphosphate carboxylase large chain